MFAWGEDYRQSFRVKNGSSVRTADPVQLLDFTFSIADLSAGHGVLAFVKGNKDASVIRTNESAAGERVRGKQKFVKCPEKIEAVSCGDDVVALLSETGSVFCVDSTQRPYTPRTHRALCDIPVTQVVCGSQHTVALTKGGQVYTWGNDSRGQLGLGKRENGADSPQHLRSLSAIPVVRIAAGGEQSFALSASGGVFGWGRNDRGQLGLGDTTDRHTPAAVHYMNTKKAVYISCGKEHTAILTKDGAVFTCGAGGYGQLGHKSFEDELCPRLVEEPWGAKATKIACGRYHTLVLTDSMKVYSFGCNEQRQLGRGEESRPSVPLPVQLPQDTTNGLIIQNIYAGGDCSFATRMPKDIHKGSNNSTTQQTIENMIDKWNSECDPKSWNNTKKEIRWTFSSASIINRSFLDESNDKHFQASASYSGLDLPLAQRVFEKLVKTDDVMSEVEDAVQQMLPSLDKEPVGVEGLRVFLILNELLRVMQKHKRQQSTKLAVDVATAVQKLSAESLQILGAWWSSLSQSSMCRHVKVWRTALSAFSSWMPVPRDSVTNILLILQNMYNANENNKIPAKTFCCEINPTFLQMDLDRWRLMDVNDPPIILGSFTFVMDLKSKKMAFDINADYTKRAPPAMGVVWPFGYAPQYTYFDLKLSRESFLEDSFKQLAAAPHTEFKKPLGVYFDGDTKFSDVYKRDFFHHLFKNIVKAKPGMFMLNEGGTLAWFSSKATEENRTNFYLFGVLCGLALYNGSMINLGFPLALFKKLLDVEPTLEDMIEFRPEVGKRLQDTLNCEADDLEALDFYFDINWDETNFDLDPQNPEKKVTIENRREFVDAYVNYAFNASVEGVFQEFKRGFLQVCDQNLLKLFRPEELQGVLVGQEDYNWVKLKKNTVYEGFFYHAGHPTIQMFWEVFDELTEDQRKDFLWFLTGYRRVPILGMGQIRMTLRDKVILSGTYDEHLPESLTCHSIVELPPYSTKQIMREKITEAVKPERGFRGELSAGLNTE
ncbi:putative E3 ubiquitin-protein ligase HERC4 [Odontesthes bonariensis]|uniref:putative E3 ubiquitin-protein ligase HERC4 n=1 Tax=Odontesthes bonariensis TaxID=219752 RepID=UPI003F586220